jgi:dihydroorotate dehydrogenase
LLSLGYIYLTDTRASVHRFVAPRLLRLLCPDAEDAHRVGTNVLKELYTLGLHPRERGMADADLVLASQIFGHVLSNPVGISGGLDKHADILDALFDLGAGVVEIGGVTPLPQDGNPKPRVFRLASQNALINRYGLNSEGADVVAMRLRQRVREYAYQQGYGMDEEAERLVLDGAAGVPPGSLLPGKLLAVQIAKNKLTPDSDLDAVVWDHVYCVDRLGKYADIIVVNVSSPNTPGLRGLQSKKPLTQILSAVVEAANLVPRKNKPVVMVKVSPDEDSDSQIQGICDAVWESGVAGVVVGNTTMKRPAPLPKDYMLPAKEARALMEFGGYSGPQLFERTLNLVVKYRKILDQGPVEDVKPSSISVPDKSTITETDASVISQIEESTKRDEAYLKPVDPESVAERGSSGREIGTDITIAESSGKSQPLLRVPERNNPFSIPSSTADAVTSPPVAISTQSTPPSPAPSSSMKRTPQSMQPKIIFASGGITNGDQALQVLQAGASVTMCYTALVYGGVGTIVRIKEEIKETAAKK